MICVLLVGSLDLMLTSEYSGWVYVDLTIDGRCYSTGFAGGLSWVQFIDKLVFLSCANMT